MNRKTRGLFGIVCGAVLLGLSIPQIMAGNFTDRHIITGVLAAAFGLLYMLRRD